MAILLPAFFWKSYFDTAKLGRWFWVNLARNYYVDIFVGLTFQKTRQNALRNKITTGFLFGNSKL